jgi:hypothetical protein
VNGINTQKLVASWITADSPDRDELLQIHELVSYLADRLYNLYEPCQFELFSDRLSQWLGNLTDEKDQKILYRLLGEIFFVGVREFESLYRAAYSGPIFRWIVESLALKFDDPHFDVQVDGALRETWFCPITDSMRINAFLKVNAIRGHSFRPDWRSMTEFADVAKIRAYVDRMKIKRIVLLEDFVGTGIQVEEALLFASRIDDNMPILGCPLLICPQGVDRSSQIVNQRPNLSISPVLALPSSMFILKDPQPDENTLFPLVRALLLDVRERLGLHTDTVHGFAGTGATIVLHSNCPDNTLPIIRDRSASWVPLFPRVER